MQTTPNGGPKAPPLVISAAVVIIVLIGAVSGHQHNVSDNAITSAHHEQQKQQQHQQHSKHTLLAAKHPLSRQDHVVANNANNANDTNDISDTSNASDINDTSNARPARRRRKRALAESGGYGNGQSLPAASLSFEAAFQGECNRDNNPCEHLCFDLHDGTYECACNSGHNLAIDGYSCTRAAPVASSVGQSSSSWSPAHHNSVAAETAAPRPQQATQSPNEAVAVAAASGLSVADVAEYNNKQRQRATHDNDRSSSGPTWADLTERHHRQQQQQQQQQQQLQQQQQQLQQQQQQLQQQHQKQHQQQRRQQQPGSGQERAQKNDKMASEQVEQNDDSDNRFNYRIGSPGANATSTQSAEDKDIARIRLENDALVEEFKHLLNLEYDDDIEPVKPTSSDTNSRQGNIADMQRSTNGMLNHLRHYYQLSSPLRPLSKQDTTTAASLNDDEDDDDDNDDVAESGSLDSPHNYADSADAVGASGKHMVPAERLMARRHLSLSSGNIRHDANNNNNNNNNNDTDVSSGGSSGRVDPFNYRRRQDEYERDLTHLLHTSAGTTTTTNSQSIPDTFNYDHNDNNDNVNLARVPSQKRLDWQQQQYDNTLSSNSNTQLATNHNSPIYTTCAEMPDCESGGICVVDQLEEADIFYSYYNISYNDIRQNTLARCRCPIGRGGLLCNKPVQVRIPNFRNESYLALPMIDDEMLDELLIEFKPSLIRESLILYTDLNEQFLALIMDSNGQIELRFHNAEDKSDDIISIRSLAQVKLLQWNKLMITSLEIDQLEEKMKQDFDKLDIVISLASLARTWLDNENSDIDVNKFASGTRTGKVSRSPLILNHKSVTQSDQIDSLARTRPKIFRPLNGEKLEEKVTLRQLFVGGSPNLASVKKRLSINSGFNGCVRQLRLNERYYNFRSDNHGDSLDGFDIDECSRATQIKDG